MSKNNTEEKKKEREYEVKLDVFFMTSQFVMAKTRREAIEKAKNMTNYGEGEELTVYEVSVVK